MTKHLHFGLALVLGLIMTPWSVGADPVRSLRGDADISGPSIASERLRVINDKEPIARSFEEQPPLVPHKVDDYTVNLAENKCLDCHSKDKAKEKDASPVSESHYETRDGAKLDRLSARRYFCTQCHVPQTEAEPLVDNGFEPVVAHTR